MKLSQVVVRIFVLVAFPLFAGAQNISGVLQNNENKAPVFGALVQVDGSYKFAVSDSKGRFLISNAGGEISVTISHISFQSEKITLKPFEEQTILLKPKTYLSEEVNISATRVTSQSGFAFSDISKEEIGKNNLGLDIPFLLNQTPSVVTTSDAGTGIGYTSIRIRGSDGTRINVTMNGIPVNDAESHQVYWVDMPDLASSVENMQVQRGLGTSTNGAGAFGGSINILMSQVSSLPYATLNSSAGSFNSFRNNVAFGTGMLSDAFAVEGRLSKISSDGYIDRAKSDLHSFYLSGGYYGKKNSLRAVILSGKEKTYQAWYGVPQDSLKTNRTYNPAGQYYDATGNLNFYDNQTDNYQQYYYQLLYSHELNQNFNFNSAFHYTKGRGYYEEYVTQDDIYGNGLLSTYGIPDFIVGTDTIAATDLIRQRWLDNDFYGATFSGNYSSEWFHLTIGGAGSKYEGDHFDEITWMKINFGIPTPYRYSENHADKSDYNVFGKISIDATENLSLFGDLQYRSVTYEFEGFDDDLNRAPQEVSHSFFNPKFGASLDLVSNQRTYFSIGLGHKEPVRDDYVNSSPTSRPEAEELLDFEAGYKFTGNAATVGLNFYSMNYKDQLVLTGKINDVGEYPRQNVERSFRRGIEMEFDWKILNNLTLAANLTISENKIENFNQFIDSSDDAGNYSQWMVAYQNTDISFSPGIISSGMIEYSPVTNITLRLTSKYVGKQYLDNTSSEDRKLDPYFISDLHLSYHVPNKIFKDFELKLAVYNLLDTEYESNGYTYPYYYNGVFTNSNYYFPQAGINFLGGVVVKI